MNNGSHLYGDANSNDSIEELEDNIDAQMMAFIGQDITENSHTGDGTETVLNQVTVSANSVNNYLFIVSAVRMSGTDTGRFQIRIGTNGTTADSQVGVDYDIPTGPSGGCLTVVAINSTHFDKTATNYVSITGQLTVGTGSVLYCNSLVVLGA